MIDQRPGVEPRPGRLPLGTRVLPRSVFYGWYVTLACMTIMFVTIGVGYYGLSVFLKPLQQEHGWSNALVSGATGMYFAVSGLASLVAGPFIDRQGPKRLMTVSIVLTAAGAASVGYVETAWQLYAAYLVMAAAYGMGSAVSVSSMLSRWFITKRAKAMSLSSTGVSLGGAVLVPIGSVLVERGGLGLAAPILGLLVAAVALPVLYLIVVPDPADLGLEPDGEASEGGARVRHQDQYRRWTRPEAARTVGFWAVFIGFAMALATQTAVLIHQLSFLGEPGKLGSRGAAALAVTTTTIGSIVARLIVGQFADRLDKRWLTVTLFVLQASAVFAYVHVDSVVGIYVVALVFGFTIGNVYMMQSLLVGELFGVMSFGAIYGVVALAGQAGSGGGLVFMGWMHDRTDGYTVPFTVLAVVNLVAAAVITGARARPVPAAGVVPAAAAPAASAGPSRFAAVDAFRTAREVLQEMGEL
jgi:MFS family permease